MEISPEYYKYYDFLYGERDVDFPMWHHFAKREEMPILEVGCGTGRVLLSFARAGYTVVGIETSDYAIQQAKSKIKATSASIFQADMSDFDLQTKNFRLVLAAHNTFLYCLSMEAQLSALQCINKHMQENALLVIDIFTPPLGPPSQEGNFNLGREFTNRDGNLIQWYLSYTVDFPEQVIHCSQILDNIDQEGVVRRTTIRFSNRIIYPREMELLLKISGFKIESVYGDYDFSAFNKNSPKMIYTARKISTFDKPGF